MVVTFSLLETRGGALLGEFTPKSSSWSVKSNEAEAVDVTIDLNSADEVSRGWRNLATPWKHSIAVDIGGRVLGGPIMPADLDDDSATLQVKARGIRVALARRSILPLAALTGPLVLPDGTPDPAMDTIISGYDLGTTGKKITQQAWLWPGWTDIPISYHDDRVGTAYRSYLAVDKDNVADALSDLSGVQNGPDIRFQMRRAGADAFDWLYESGTEAQPRLQGPDQFVVDIGQESGLRITTDPTRMGSLSWSTGGRSSDTTLIASLYDPFLVDAGFPMLELTSGASSTTTDPDTLQAWNVETLRTARKPWEFWSFRLSADKSPFPFEYREGDLIDVAVSADTPVSGGFVDPGTYTRRIASIAGDDSDSITITCGEFYG